MTVLEALAKLTGLTVQGLVDLFVAAATAAPDLKPKLDEWLAKLQSSITPENLTELAAALPGELGDVLRLHFNPADHPGDAI